VIVKGFSVSSRNYAGHRETGSGGLENDAAVYDLLLFLVSDERIKVGFQVSDFRGSGFRVQGSGLFL
jgi:hypothetical protein